MERLPEYIITAADRIAAIYYAAETDIMLHLADLVAKNNGITVGAEWDLRMLAEMGSLREYNYRLLAQCLSGSDAELEAAVEAAARNAVAGSQPLYDRAVNLGILQEAPAAEMTVSFKQTITGYYSQAKSYLNFTNTSMLHAADQAYRDIIDKTTLQMISGHLTRQEALQQTVEGFSARGLPALTDRAGREWSPEGYINMVLRTTMSNTARDIKFGRMDDYGISVIKVPYHAGARPLCAPYQNGLYDRNNSGGYIEDVDGQRHRYEPLSDTSYGEPAGLFGINCGHMNFQECVPGAFVRRDEMLSDAELKQAQREYDESQRQRSIERSIRGAKREINILERSGMNSSHAKEKLANRQQAMRNFIGQTGRARRPDRERIYTK